MFLYLKETRSHLLLFGNTGQGNCFPIFSLNLNALILQKCGVDRCVEEAFVGRRGARGTLGARRNGDLEEVAPISKLYLLPSLEQDHWFGFRNL